MGTLTALRRLELRLLVPAYLNFARLFAGSGVVMSTLGVSVRQLAGRPARVAVCGPILRETSSNQ